MTSRSLAAPSATGKRLTCDCGHPATHEVPITQFVFHDHYRNGVPVQRWLPLCDACFALHRAVETGVTGKRLAAILRETPPLPTFPNGAHA